MSAQKPKTYLSKTLGKRVTIPESGGGSMILTPKEKKILDYWHRGTASLRIAAIFKLPPENIEDYLRDIRCRAERKLKPGMKVHLYITNWHRKVVEDEIAILVRPNKNGPHFHELDPMEAWMVRYPEDRDSRRTYGRNVYKTAAILADD